MGKKKSDNAEVSRRVEEILRIRLDGAEFHDIVQFASEKKWDVTERQLRTYISRADDLLVERQEKNRKRVIARHRAQRQALYARAVNAADYRTALAILTDLAKLQALYATDRGPKDQTAALRERIRQLEGLKMPSLEECAKLAREAVAEAQAAEPKVVELRPPPLEPEFSGDEPRCHAR